MALVALVGVARGGAEAAEIGTAGNPSVRAPAAGTAQTPPGRPAQTPAVPPQAPAARRTPALRTVPLATPPGAPGASEEAPPPVNRLGRQYPVPVPPRPPRAPPRVYVSIVSPRHSPVHRKVGPAGTPAVGGANTRAVSPSMSSPSSPSMQ
ncbi:MAG TPA: hypothetical protein VFD84_12425 [Candidatus Binatia bacterium]|nr:hypothetical protein [Candidatus Binatia bacterium]